jgi:glycosyltransferase involved in cell wall biosynthesis
MAPRKLRILLCCAADLGRSSGSVVRARLIAAGLSRCGAAVYVVALGVPPDFARNGVESVTVGPGDRWREAVFASAESFRPDILLGITEAEMDVLADAAARFRLPVVFDLHGIGAVEILELGREYGPRWGRVLASLRWLSRIPRATVITVANPTLFAFLKRFNRRVVPVIGITDVSLFHPDGPSVALGSSGAKLQVLYAGNCFKWQGVELLVEAIRILSREREPIEFTLMGTPRRDASVVASWKTALSGEGVYFREAVDYGEVPGHVRGADLLVIPRPFMLSTYLAFPQKLVDYMAAGKAIVATNLSPHRYALASPPCGLLCPPSARGLVEGIRVGKDGNLRREMAANARREAVERFCHLRQTSRMHTLFAEIVRGTAP